MPALSMKVTSAGRAALVNADNTGTLPVLVAQIGVTATGFTANPAGTDTVLPGEFKRLTTFAGDTVAADTLHVILRDDSTDFYSLKGFALYLADGTLFALYGQAEEIMGKSAQSTLLLATDVQFSDIDAASLTFGDTSFLNPPATTEVLGVVELSTNAEASAGIDPVRAVTPAGMKYTLDQRFGTGAPSVFIKGLLNLTTAALLRAAIEIKSAALKDEGTGNGLDADLLDGQHGAYYLAWGNLIGVPGSFTPSAHPHSAADINSGTLAVARGGTGLSTYTAGSFIYASAAGVLGQRTPAQVRSDIGAAEVDHSHAATDIISGTLAAARMPAYTGDVTSVAGTTANTIANGAVTLAKIAPLAASSFIGNNTAAAATPIALSGAQALALTGVTATAAELNFSDGVTSNIQSQLNAKAPLSSPTFTGTPTAPTAAAATNTTQIATTAFVQAAIAAALSNYLPKNNPTFTGTMTGPAYNKAP